MLIPRIEFGVSRVLNEFCHLSVLYSELMPVELAEGMLGNKAYQSRHRSLQRDDLRLELQSAAPFGSQAEWYTFAAGLMKRDGSGGFESLSRTSKFTEIFQKVRLRKEVGFGEIWSETRPRLEEYKDKFESQWSPISEEVLSRLSKFAKTPWRSEKITVHFVDCLWGGFGWDDCIGFAPFPDMEVQKKFLAHELSELITPQRIVSEALRAQGLNLGVTHTVVDMLAYFSVRDFIGKHVFPNPERKGIRPNPNYYLAVEELYPIFESYFENTSKYSGFSSLVQDIVLKLKPAQASVVPTAH
jgi:hypothetical protein